ncbi:MAG: hypothetical protein WCB51_11225 [Candidatus Dormiibacterota bacterium]
MMSHVRNRVRPGRRIPEFLAVGAGMVAVLATACGTATPRPSASSTSGVTTPSPSPSATPMPATTTFKVLIVRETGVDSWTLDLYDSATQKTSTIPTVDLAPDPARFASAGRISYMTSAGHLVSQNLDGSGRRVEVAIPILQYGWEPDGSLAYTTDTGVEGGKLVIRPAHGASTTVDLGMGTGYPWTDLQSKVQFSPDGKLVLGVQFAYNNPDHLQSPTVTLQVRRLDGTLAFEPPGSATEGEFSGGCRDVTMAAWGPDGKLYFCDYRGINVAVIDTGAVRTLKAATRWWDPDISPDGNAIFQTGTIVKASSGPLRIQHGPLELLDTTTGATLPGPQRADGTLARFVSPSVIWFYDGSNNAHMSTPILAYDRSTHTESQTGLTGWLTDLQLTG